jgi:hypothetical protein
MRVIACKERPTPAARMQMLALDGPARRWKPKKLRFRLYSAAVRGSRRLRLRLDSQC